MLELELMSVLGVEAVPPVAEPETEPEPLMSVLVPGVVVLPAPMEVPLPMELSVLGVVVLGVVVLAVLLLVVSLGVVVVEGVVLEVDDELAASSFLLQALRDKAAIRARAAHCAIGDLIIRKLLEGVCRWNRWEA